MKSKPLRLIHVTDIHFSKDSLDQSRSMIRSLGEDLQNILSKDEENILLITGDIANHGSDSSQYNSFYEAYEEYLEPLGMTVCSIPGNHDTSRTYVQKNFPTLLGLSENLPELSGLTAYLDGNPSSFNEAMKEYVDFESAFANLPTCQDSIYGAGHQLADGFGIYCLNSGFYSFGGHKVEKRETDQGFLLSNIGHIQKWINKNPEIKHRILALHHPLEWFRPDVRRALETIVNNNFGLVLFGHIHEASPVRYSTPTSNTLLCQGGAISSNEIEKLFYQTIKIDPITMHTELEVRHFSRPNQKFVSGSTVTATNNGKITYETLWQSTEQQKFSEAISKMSERLDEALCSPVTGCDSCYVPPSITEQPLFNSGDKRNIQTFSVSTISRMGGDIVIHAPPQYGGSVLALEFTIELLRQNEKCLLLSALTTPSYKAKLDPYLELKLRQSNLPDDDDIETFVIDDYNAYNRNHERLISLLKSEFPECQLIIINRLHTIIRDGGISNPVNNSTAFYLNALSRTKVRQIIAQHPANYVFSQDDDISSHILDEIERLNLHRIPFNVIMIMELVAENRHFTPLNRAKLVRKYFELVFNREEDSFEYSEGMDFEDRMHFLTRFTSSLIESSNFTFSEAYWIQFCQDYARDFGPVLSPSQELEIYIKANIFVKNGDTIHFRLSMWTWYFLANRVVDDPVFKEEMLESRKYQSYPQVLEFATGINRKQSDVLQKLGVHLKSATREYELESGLGPDFLPYDGMSFLTDEENIESFQTDLIEQVLGTTPDRELVDNQKDEIYDHAAPFRQIVHNQVYTANLIKLYRTLEATGLCIRNSDHVPLAERLQLTQIYFEGLERFAQAAFLSIPEMVEQGSASVSGMLFIPPRDLPNNFDEAAMRIVLALPQRLGQSVMEHVGSTKYWALLAEQRDLELSQLGKYMITFGMIELRNTDWFSQLLNYLNDLSPHSIYVELTSRLLWSELHYGGFSADEKVKLEKGYVATMMKQRKVKNITVDGVEKDYRRYRENANKEQLGK